MHPPLGGKQNMTKTNSSAGQVVVKQLHDYFWSYDRVVVEQPHLRSSTKETPVDIPVEQWFC
jgi:hypothetical protein